MSSEPLWRILSGLEGLASQDLSLTSGSELTPGVRLFHDGRDIRCVFKDGLTLELTAFSGSYVSLAMEIPTAQAEKMREGHLLEVTFRADASHPTLADIRVNFERAEGLAQVGVNRVLSHGGYRCLLDLAHTEIGEVSAVWVDLILRRPWDRMVKLRDLTIALCPRSAGFDRRYRF